MIDPHVLYRYQPPKSVPGEAVKLTEDCSNVDILLLPPKLKQKLKDCRSNFFHLATYIHASIIFKVHVEWVGLASCQTLPWGLPLSLHTNKRNQLQQTVMFPFHSVKAEYVLSHSLLHLDFVCTRMLDVFINVSASSFPVNYGILCHCILLSYLCY